MYANLRKGFITKYLLPFLSNNNLGRKTKVPLWRIVKAIIFRLKTGCQWRELPIAQFASPILLRWQSVYYHFRKWTKDGSWKKMWTGLLDKFRCFLNMSSVQLDGSHTPAKRGGQAVAYQGRKKCKTTNALFLTDKQGIPLAMSECISGNHNDLFEIEKSFTKIVADLKAASLNPNGLFMNADAGFDSKEYRKLCFIEGIEANIDINKRNAKIMEEHPFLDDLLYKERFSVERTNAWIDAFKALLTRFETLSEKWMGLHYICFSLILIRRVERSNKSF